MILTITDAASSKTAELIYFCLILFNRITKNKKGSAGFALPLKSDCFNDPVFDLILHLAVQAFVLP